MINRYEFFLTTKCLDLLGFTNKICLPKKVLCLDNPTDSFIAECDKLYCNIKKVFHPQFCQPFIKGEKFMIQTVFKDWYNPDPLNPVAGWGIAFNVVLCTPTGDITDMNAFVSRHYVCHNGFNSYQVLEIDTSLPNFPDCFNLKFFSVDTNNVVKSERCSQALCKAEDCTNVVTLEGCESDYDCYGNYYGEPKCSGGFKFSNKIWAYGRLSKGFPIIERTNTATTIIETRVLNFLKLTPQYFIDFLSKQIFSNKIIKINNISINSDKFVLNSKLDLKEVYSYEAIWETSCENKNC